jgi:hypothetical protein
MKPAIGVQENELNRQGRQGSRKYPFRFSQILGELGVLGGSNSYSEHEEFVARAGAKPY